MCRVSPTRSVLTSPCVTSAAAEMRPPHEAPTTPALRFGAMRGPHGDSHTVRFQNQPKHDVHKGAFPVPPRLAGAQSPGGQLRPEPSEQVAAGVLRGCSPWWQLLGAHRWPHGVPGDAPALGLGGGRAQPAWVLRPGHRGALIAGSQPPLPTQPEDLPASPAPGWLFFPERWEPPSRLCLDQGLGGHERDTARKTVTRV